MRKRFTKILCLALSFIMLAVAFSSCTKKPGLYNWLGIRMDVDYLLKLTLNVGDGDVDLHPLVDGTFDHPPLEHKAAVVFHQRRFLDVELGHGCFSVFRKSNISAPNFNAGERPPPADFIEFRP